MPSTKYFVNSFSKIRCLASYPAFGQFLAAKSLKRNIYKFKIYPAF